MESRERAPDFYSLLMEAAREEGFPLAGALDIDSVLSPQGEFKTHIDRYDRWLASGYHGAMEYLARGRDRRAGPRLVLPEAQSILCVAIPYPAQPAGAGEPSRGPRYARYIRRNDYHDDIAERLERVMDRVRERWESRDEARSSDAAGNALMSASPRAPLKYKVCVDTSAVLERSWAAFAGLGWIGKNTLLIHPQHGSYLFLGEVLISEKTGHGPKPLPNYCGSCTRCLDACPTKAIREPGTVDSNRCIAYWSLEKRGELPIQEQDRRSIGTWIAGCDVCQEVCPFNTKPTRAASLEILPPGADAATSLSTWRELLEETLDQYKARIKDSALSRVKPAQFSRNLAITLANVILDAGPDAAWVTELKPLIEKRAGSETDPVARTEWVRCLSSVSNSKA